MVANVKIIVGLGNPGSRYENTRHNAGFLSLDALARNQNASPWRSRCHSVVSEYGAETRIVLAKPLTFMNLSGHAVRPLLEAYEASREHLLVVLDDLNLPFGRIRVRAKGSSGGHKGLDSIFNAIGTREIIRIRLGIGEEEIPSDKSKFVLSEFPASRKGELKTMIQESLEVVATVLKSGPAKAMSIHNA